MSNQTMGCSSKESDTPTSTGIILLADSFREKGLHKLKSLGCKVVLEPSLCDEHLLEAIKSTNPDVLVVRSTKVTKEMLEASDRLSLVVRAGAGYDTIDVASASKCGVFVANCPNKNAIAVAELTWSLILACDRRVPDQVIDLRSGRWDKKEYSKAAGLFGRTLGIVGLGGIGKEVVARGKAFGMNIVVWSRSFTDKDAVALGVERCESLLNVAKMSDVVSVHLASTPETENIIDADFLNAMRDGAIIINTSRGKVIDESALVRAVQEKHLSVGLDVYQNEPSTGKSEFSPAITKQQSVYGTHHIGASTSQAQDAIAMEAVRVISTYIASGEVPNCVNRAKATPAKALLCVRHLNLPGVLAHVFESISLAGVNVEEMENILYEGGHAACARIQLGELPSEKQLEQIRDNNNVLSVTLTPINE
jgi:D-3-phosphoglycerate dehydrogenase / 2-oxoglutarate reductase